VAQQYFNLSLKELGPYALNYSRNGRYLLLGGRKGHLASFDWRGKELQCEIQVRETIRDIHYLHNETMFAAAQKRFVYIYDDHGTEIHCIKKMEHVNKLTFLPYHYLLVSASERGILSYLDVSIGQIVTRHSTGLGPLRQLTHNLYNGLVHLGHHQGSVTLWSPNMGKPIVKMLCHRGRVTGLAVDREGRYMVTAGMDSQMRVWDIRQYKPVHAFHTRRPATSLDISQRGLVALGYEKQCQVWQDVFSDPDPRPPCLQYELKADMHQLEFCPFEDALGIGHSQGLSSIIVPGAGEPNIDALEVNPYQTKGQRREWEVKSLLEKIPSELIMGNPLDLCYVKKDREAAEDKGTQIKVNLRRRLRGRSTPGKLATRKQILKDRMARTLRKKEIAAKRSKEKEEKETSKQPLDRFR
jgi:U3 small nucleolar RNA-associated protein 7